MLDLFEAMDTAGRGVETCGMTGAETLGASRGQKNLYGMTLTDGRVCPEGRANQASLRTAANKDKSIITSHSVGQKDQNGRKGAGRSGWNLD